MLNDYISDYGSNYAGFYQENIIFYQELEESDLELDVEIEEQEGFDLPASQEPAEA